MATTKELTDQVVGAVQGYVARCMAGMTDQIKALGARLDALPPVEQLKGADGAAGPQGEKGIDGQHGTKGDPGDVGPAGKDGERGEKGDPGERGPQGEPGPAGKDGAPGAAGGQGEKGIDGQDGRDGEPGRDAPHVDVLDGIDGEKRYQRGTWASYRGGVIRSFRATDPLPDGEPIEKAGWHVIVRGLADLALEVADDLRTVTLRHTLTDGHTVTRSVAIPAMVYRGVWRDGEAYAKGDTATRGGSAWVLMAEQQAGKPGDENSGWQLAVKKGTDGRDGIKGEKGDRGAEGRGGRDLTQMGPDGTKW